MTDKAVPGMPPDTLSIGLGHPASLDGYWILTDYLDSILKDRSISKHRMYPIAWSAMALNIHRDTLYSTGLINGSRGMKVHSYMDTLAVIEGYGKYALRYNTRNDYIEATAISTDQAPKTAARTFKYRRVTEGRLKRILQNNDQRGLKEGFYQLFIDSLIAGEYTSLNDGHALVLTSDGIISGFRSYNRYRIHDYFGTLHPFGNYDALWFEDTTAISSGQFPPPPSAIQFFHWSFSGDTLLLTEMMTDNYDEYYLGKRRYTFIRTRR
jgi:hypothetical protein